LLNLILPAVLVLVFLAIIAAIILSIASKKFKVEIDPKIMEIIDKLPGANCGACGSPGCSSFAENLVNEDKPMCCPVLDEKGLLAISNILGKGLSCTEKQVARVFCNGSTNFTRTNKNYDGIKNCNNAKLLGGSSKSCSYACYGFGTCIEVCAFNAIKVDNGIAVIDSKKCVACGLCLNSCPQNIIKLIPLSKKVVIPCSSEDKGAIAKQYCNVSCISCSRCVKECPSQAISIVKNHAVIDYSKCTNCKKCISVCPMKMIKEEA